VRFFVLKVSYNFLFNSGPTYIKRMVTKYQCVFAPFRLDSESARLWRNGEEISLRRKTFEVLRYLVDHPAQLVTKAELLDAVWAEVAVSDTMPAISVAELRKVMGDDARQPIFIETVHKRGYRFIAPVTRTTAVSPGLRSPLRAPAPLIGRETEMSALRRHLDQVRNGLGGVMLISGIAGVGKTRLAMELGIEATQGGILTLIGHCYDRGDPVPFVPFVEILEAALASAPNREAFRAMLGAEAAEISRLLPQLRRLFPDIHAPLELAPAQSQRMLFNAVGELLTHMATAAPLFLLLEDLHWADQGTLSLLNHLARTVPKFRVLVVGTYRGNELDATSSLAHTLEELNRLQVVEQLRLAGLTQEAVAQMLRSFGGQEPPPNLIKLLHKTTEGNPFFVGELFRHLAERGKLGDFDHTVRTELTLDQLELPQSVRLVIGRRLNRVGDEARSVLAAAAVIGRSFPFALLEAATRIDPGLLRDYVETAERAGLLTSALQYPDAHYNFAHELIRQAVFSDLSARRCQELHLQIADAIEQLYPNTLEDWSDDLAHHLWEAGLIAAAERTLKWLKAAARHAITQGAHAAAIRYFRRALESLKRLPPSRERSRQEIRLHISMTGPLIAIKGYTAPEVEAACSRASELCQSLGELPELFAVLGGLYSVHYIRDDLITANGLAEQLLRLAKKNESRVELLWAHYTLGCVQYRLGDFTLARESFEQVAELYERGVQYGFAHDPGTLALSYLAQLLHTLGYPDQALRTTEKALALARELSHTFTLAVALGHAGLVRYARGEFAAAEGLIEEMLAIAERHGFEGLEAQGSGWIGSALVEEGKVDEGLSRIEFSVDRLAADSKMDGTFERFRLANAHRKTGRPEEGLAEVARLEARAAARGFRHRLDAELLQLKGELLLLVDVSNNVEADQCFRTAIEIARRRSTKAVELTANTHLARLLAKQGRRDEARTMLAAIYSWFTEGFDTADLKDAKALLEELEQERPVRSALGG